MTRLAAAATALEYGVHRVLRGVRGPSSASSSSPWLDVLRTDGAVAVPGYLTASECQQARTGIDELLQTETDAVHFAEDQRLFGVERRLKAAATLATDPEIMSLATTLYGEAVRTAFVLGARLDAADTFGGSGGGWHRDSFGSQCKAIVYLTDVDEDHGPFQLIRGSHRLEQITNDIQTAGLRYRQTRINNQAEALLDERPDRVMTFAASAGTLILADTSAIHRGMPIATGVRYALTSYIFPERLDAEAIDTKFAPIVGFAARD